MSRISKAALLAFAVATLAGSCLHFVYALFPNGLTAVLAPVNESIWEHLKILVWPCVLGAVPLLRREPDGLGARAFSLLLAAGLMLAAGWLYHGVLDGRALLDLDYPEDSHAEVDLNLVGTGDGRIVEVQGTGERSTLDRAQLDALLDLCQGGIARLTELQADVTGYRP